LQLVATDQRLTATIGTQVQNIQALTLLDGEAFGYFRITLPLAVAALGIHAVGLGDLRFWLCRGGWLFAADNYFAWSTFAH
jgi:hypothetical protein